MHDQATDQFDALVARQDQLESRTSQLTGEFARLGRDLRLLHEEVEAMRQSRIWRTLVWAAEFLTGNRWRLRRMTSRFQPLAAPHPARVTDPPRAWSSRHLEPSATLARWEERIRTVAGSLRRVSPGIPRISLITPTWNTAYSWFAQAALSVLEQKSADWEWHIVDDASYETEFHALFHALEETGRVHIHILEEHAGISEATNEGLRAARGEYVCFLDHDDMLAPEALAECLAALDSDLDAVYTDSDKIDESGVRSEPFHKPDWSPEYFRGVMYVGHLLCVRRQLALQIGGFDPAYDRIQDFEFMLRFSERCQRIGHISRVLYHWRAVPGSVAGSTQAKGDIGDLQRSAVEAHLHRLRLPATARVTSTPHRLRIQPRPRSDFPTVSVIVPTKDAPEVLQKCLYGIFKRTTYPRLEILCVDNETTDPRALLLLRSERVRRLPFPGRFNFSRSCNHGASHAVGEYLVFLNNDVEVMTPDWVEQMLYYAEQTDVGAVGGLLLYPNRTVQHAGVVLGCRGTADHVLRGAPADSDGYAGSLSCAREVSAVTAACMMINKRLFVETGSFNEHYFTAYQDVDLCLQLRSLEKRNIFCPRSVFLHTESYSRGDYYDFVDRNLLLDRWDDMIASDPYYNPNFDVEACDYSLLTSR